MEALFRSGGVYLLALVALVIVWNAGWFGYFLWKRKKRNLPLPKPGDEDVVFVEQFASGCSHKNLMTRWGGASRCLTVIVTRSHLAVTTFFPFTALAEIFDLEHLIPLSEVRGVEERGRAVEVEFARGDGGSVRLSLRLRDTPGFLRALRGGPAKSA